MNWISRNCRWQAWLRASIETYENEEVLRSQWPRFWTGLLLHYRRGGDGLQQTPKAVMGNRPLENFETNPNQNTHYSPTYDTSLVRYLNSLEAMKAGVALSIT